MYVETIEEIIALDKLKNKNNLYANIDEGMQKIIRNKEDKEIEKMVRNAYRNSVIVYVRKYEELIWEVIKDEQSGRYKNKKIFGN